MKNIFLYFIQFCFPLLVFAQTDTTYKGIKWTTGLNLEQLKAKAKEEGKYIFIDCFATWCGPCKTMDQQVFADKEVGDIVNEKYISLKVQMDRTQKDNEHVQKWYNNAALIREQYSVEAYPTFIFISPDGMIVSKEIGAMRKEDFIAKVKAALVPGQMYHDPYTYYEKLKEDYQNGIKKYERFPFMINLAYKRHDTSFGRKLMNEHTEYIMDRKPEELFSKDNIQLWAGFLLKSGSRRFKFFYENGKRIDEVMKEKGYAARVVDATIWNEIIYSFLETQAKGSGIQMVGMMLGGPGATRLKHDYSEADWKMLRRMLSKRYEAGVVRRNLVAAKVQWYLRHRNYKASIKYYTVKLKKYTFDYNKEIVSINNFVWDVFLNVTDKKLMNKVLPWGKKAIQLAPRYANLLDSYANLLYKAGKQEAAIFWQEKSVQIANADQSKRLALEQMRKNQPTYLNEGALWGDVSIRDANK
ncbi:thioredoxin family protein [Longitalea luteola]|uniref:thioredoxin family protein n=1 Tax=Longitalea luteola TaxID=2812563 RepID=UPI001A963B23|nr:thioredoxin family protein [Longitalea luteola]